jgi:hypothetical protein
MAVLELIETQMVILFNIFLIKYILI